MTTITDKRTDVWSRNFIIWEINFGLLADAWAAPWEKGVWADSEQLFLGGFFNLSWAKNLKKNKILHCSVRTEKVHRIKLEFFKNL